MALQTVGPLLARTAQPLPVDVSAFLDSGLKTNHKAVYVSMGTFTGMNAEELQSLAQGLGALPNPVLWKLPAADLPGRLYSKPDTSEISNV